MSNVQDNAAHTCSYSCDRPECIKAQRDELAAAAAQEAVGVDSYDDALDQLWKLAGGNDHPVYKRFLGFRDSFAAPVTAAPADLDAHGLRALANCIADLRRLIELADDYALDEIQIQSLLTAIETMELRKVASTPAAPGIDLATAWAEGYRSGVTDERISESNIGIAGFGAKIEPARANPYMIDASPKEEAKPVAYLDIGAGGYMDVGTDLSDDELQELPKGRHMLGIIGTFGIGGYVPAGSPKGGSEARDAARYQWLRDPQTRVGLVLDKVACEVPYDEGTKTGGYCIYEYRCGEELDGAIDAAMQAGDAGVQP